jgi:hypothetical protein
MTESRPDSGEIDEESKINEKNELREEIINFLLKQGYSRNGNFLSPPIISSKDEIRKVHSLSVLHSREKKKKSLEKFEDRFIERISNGDEVDIRSCFPRLKLVRPDTEDSAIFSYISSHWSIPVSSGYGRRIRYLVEDESNGKVMGIIGLGDPVYAMECREKYIGWSRDYRRDRLYNVMEAYLLGAVPPYNEILCGKLMALLAMSSEVVSDFQTKYHDKASLISGLNKPADLVLLSTSSALGHSSVYDRLRVGGEIFWEKIGLTKGTGDFQFSNEVYSKMIEHVRSLDSSPEKNEKWGRGFRNKREVVRKCLKSLNLDGNLMTHGIKREVYVAQTCKNSLEYLRGETDVPIYIEKSVEDLFNVFRDRWMIPRSIRNKNYLSYDKNTYRLWNI